MQQQQKRKVLKVRVGKRVGNELGNELGNEWGNECGKSGKEWGKEWQRVGKSGEEREKVGNTIVGTSDFLVGSIKY